MKHFIHTIELVYIGEEEYNYKYKDGVSYKLKNGDVLVMPKDHFARYLLAKSFFKEKKLAFKTSSKMNEKTSGQDSH